MTFQRSDGRELTQIRPMEVKAGIVPNAKGSALFRAGKTTAYAAVYGPRELHPKRIHNPKTGILRCSYNMMPFSGMGDRVRSRVSRRSKEISLVMERALNPIVDLTDFPNSVVDVFVEMSETDAGSRCAAINAAVVALAQAGIKMKDMVSAVAVGVINGDIAIDLSYEEEAYEGSVADIPVAMIHNTKEITLLQGDGDVTREQLKQALKMVEKAMDEIHTLQRKALLELYKVEENGN